MMRFAAYFSAVVLLCVAVPTLAAIESFPVQFMYGEDTEAPTVPEPVTVEPIASSQINVTWTASTDNIQVAGYQLFRDAVQIATTSLTSFVDTGLTASTTYSYAVIAVDIFGNFSTSTTPVATTTLALPPPPPEDPELPPPPGTLLLMERAFTISASTNGARFSWETNIPTTFVLRYGLNSDFDDGVMRSIVYTSQQETAVTGLQPGTTYQYELVLTDIYGRTKVFKAGSFTTESLPDTTPPTNVGAFVATAAQNDVLLRWVLPTDSDFAYVRVVRNHRFFPQHDTDGFVVYEGSVAAFTDSGALTQYDTQYYTIFAYDFSGNRSSGAVAIARRYGVVGTTPGVSTPFVPPGTTPAQGDAVGDRGAVDPTPDDAILALYPEQVFVEQRGQAVSFAGRDIEVVINSPYTVWVPASALPPHLKAIIVSVKNPTDQREVASYLLQLDEERGRYEATIPGFLVVGESMFMLEVFDFNASQVREITVPVRFVAPADPTSVPLRNWWSLVWEAARPLGLIALLSLGVWWFFLLLRRRDDDEDNS